MKERFQYMIQNTKFQLPDRSTGYLNSGSTLKFPVKFSNDRSVELNGESFFEVVRDEVITFHATFIDEPLGELLKLISITTPITFKERKEDKPQRWNLTET